MLQSQRTTVIRYDNGTLVRISASAHEFTSYDYNTETHVGTFQPASITITADFHGNTSFGRWLYSYDGDKWTAAQNNEHGITLGENSLTIASGSDLFTDQTPDLTIKCESADGEFFDTVTLTRQISPLYLYSKAETAINQTNRKIALIASDEQLAQYTESQTMVSKMASIELTANSITQEVHANYATKAYTDSKLANYSTTAQMQSAISQTATSITQAVSSTYATKVELDTATDGTLIFQTPYEINGGVATLTAKVYRNGNDVTNEFADGQFDWFINNSETGEKVYQGAGKTFTVDMDTVTYGTTVIGEFLQLTESEALTTHTGEALTTHTGEELDEVTPKAKFDVETELYKQGYIEEKFASLQISDDEILAEVGRKTSGEYIASQIHQTASAISLLAQDLNLSGYVTINSLKSGGTTEIDGSRVLTGIISDKNGNNYWNLDTGEFQLKPVSDLNTSLNQQGIYNRLTNNVSQGQGIYLENGILKVNASQIKAGDLDAARIKANTIGVEKLTGKINDSGKTWEIDLEKGTMTLGSISAGKITAGTIAGEVYASAFHITGGSINIHTDNSSLDFIVLELENENKSLQYSWTTNPMETVLYEKGTSSAPGGKREIQTTYNASGLTFENYDVGTRGSAGVGGISFRKGSNDEVIASINSSTGAAYFSSLEVAGTTVTGAADAYASRLASLYKTENNNSLFLPHDPKNNVLTYWNGQPLENAFSAAIASAKAYADSLDIPSHLSVPVPDRSGLISVTNSGNPISGISKYEIAFYRFGPMIIGTAYFTLSGTSADSSNNVMPPAHVQNAYFSLGSISFTDKDSDGIRDDNEGDGYSGYGFIDKNGAVKIRTTAPGTYYGLIIYVTNSAWSYYTTYSS